MTALLVIIYLAFIGLGLPDSLHSNAWPAMQISLGAPLGMAGVAAMTALALLGISFNSVWMLMGLAVPLGLGAGSVDATLNNFVALHYKAMHMSWLHCCWGLGATAGKIH